MVKKKVNKKNVFNNEEEVVDLEKATDLEDFVMTSLTLPKDDLKRLRIESATEGVSMASILRGFVKGHFKDKNNIRKRIEDNFFNVLKDSVSGLFSDRFRVNTFVEKMLDVDIKISDLNDHEKESLLNSFEQISYIDDSDDWDCEDLLEKISSLYPDRDFKNSVKEKFPKE